MGTNFYSKSGQHIGKRSAVGYYCWDCEIKCNGEECPNCGKTFEGNVMAEGAVAVELGFAKPYTRSERNGVRRVSSFTWAMDPKLRLPSAVLACNLPFCNLGLRKVVDGYGKTYSFREFREQVLANCPIQIFAEIGRNFT